MNLNSANHVTICKKCHSVSIYFDENKRADSGKLIPLEVETKSAHNCDISNAFPCMWCTERIYLDKNFVSENGKRIPLNYETEEPHFCPKKPKTSRRELKFFRKRGVFED